MTDLKILENLWWLLLAAFWVVFGVVCLFLGEYLIVVVAVGALIALLASARLTAVQRQVIRQQQATIASLEQALREAHRRDYR